MVGSRLRAGGAYRQLARSATVQGSSAQPSNSLRSGQLPKCQSSNARRSNSWSSIGTGGSSLQWAVSARSSARGVSRVVIYNTSKIIIRAYISDCRVFPILLPVNAKYGKYGGGQARRPVLRGMLSPDEFNYSVGRTGFPGSGDAGAVTAPDHARRWAARGNCGASAVHGQHHWHDPGGDGGGFGTGGATCTRGADGVEPAHVRRTGGHLPAFSRPAAGAPGRGAGPHTVGNREGPAARVRRGPGHGDRDALLRQAGGEAAPSAPAQGRASAAHPHHGAEIPGRCGRADCALELSPQPGGDRRGTGTDGRQCSGSQTGCAA